MDTDYINNSIYDGLEFWQEKYGNSELTPVISPTLEILNNQLNLSWAGESGMLYKILATTNLASGAWEPLSNSLQEVTN